jgi:hypothetical protein
MLLCVASVASKAAEQDEESYDASGDYIKSCKYATCVKLLASEWSENNPLGVAVSVRMGTKSVVTDDQIKMVLTQDFKHYDVGQIKFFYEQNDTPATGIFLHVRGGTEGLYLIDSVRQQVPLIAERAKNLNPAFISNSKDLKK